MSIISSPNLFSNPINIKLFIIIAILILVIAIVLYLKNKKNAIEKSKDSFKEEYIPPKNEPVKILGKEPEKTTYQQLMDVLNDDEPDDPDEFSKYDSPDIKVSYRTIKTPPQPKKKKRKK